MSVKSTIEENKNQALKDKDTVRLEALRMLLSAIKNEEINKQKELSDEDVQKIVMSQTKQLKDALKDFESGGRDDLIQKTKAELEILKEYLPEQMSDEELEKIVKSVVEKTGASSPSDMGKVMGAVMGEVKGKADGTRVKEAVMKMLG